MKNHVLHFLKPYEIKILLESVPVPQSNEVLIQNYFSAISAGTEMLVYRGQVPEGMLLDENIAELKQPFEYPCQYGYSAVGKIIATGSELSNNLVDQWVFSFSPHQSFCCIAANDFIILPEDITPEEALFLSNMETAVNLILDGKPLLGERIIVFGLGIVGLLVTAILQQFPLKQLITIDCHEQRRAMSLELGADMALATYKPYSDTLLNSQADSANTPLADLIFELSGNPDTLNDCIASAGFESRIVAGSWYGKNQSIINLGDKFHRNRINIISSQVTTLASKLQGRWNKKRRLEMALNMLQLIKPARLVTHKFPITSAPEAYELLDQNQHDAMQVILTY